MYLWTPENLINLFYEQPRQTQKNSRMAGGDFRRQPYIVRPDAPEAVAVGGFGHSGAGHCRDILRRDMHGPYKGTQGARRKGR